MSVWPIGDGFRAVSAHSRELLNSWNDDEVNRNEEVSTGSWTSTNGLLSELQRTQSSANLPSMELDSSAPVIPPPETKAVEAHPITERLELSIERVDSRAAFNKYVPLKDTSVSPLTRVNLILEEHSETSRWLNQRGYLEAFKSPNCMLDITFSTEKTLLKVGAVLNAPDGSRRTVVACDDGTSFQRITGPRGQEIVRFMANGQIVEFGKRSGEMLKPKTAELQKPKTSEFDRIV